MKNRFLFELGTEEIPADMIQPAAAQLLQNLQGLLRAHELQAESVEVLGSSRRLAVLAEGLPDRQPDREEVVLGPPRSVALDAHGQPGPAAQGFARKVGVKVEALETVETDRGPYLGLRRRVAGKPVPEILTAILPELIASISWPKNMYWRESRFRFIRPLRWFVTLWNRTVLPFEFEGVSSGRVTRGHRFLGRRDVVLETAEEYVTKLRENYVLADPAERRAQIARELEQATPAGFKLLPDQDLLDLACYLNEYPTVLRGSFNAHFLAIPQEVLVTVMRHHQKYFSLVDSAGALQPYFLVVANTNADPKGQIRRGHEKVLKARLEDAAFFWSTDQKTPLRERVVQLGHVLFQERLGSYLDKTERVRAICARMQSDPLLDAAAQLCKVDLTTDMVRELTELQGIMGGLYARGEGYPEEVWKAIYEHYLPVSLDGPSPSTRTGALLSVADKLDTIAGCFTIGIVPTGSSDPFALRRQAQGLVKILLDHRLDEFALPQLADFALANFTVMEVREQTRDEIQDFLGGRVRYILQERGFSYDVVNAVLAVGFGRVYQTYMRAVALASIRGETDFEALAVAYKRIKNILTNQPVERSAISETELVEAEEVALYRVYRELRPRVESSLGGGDYVTALRHIASLRSPVDRFFDAVMVLTEDAALRSNRLRLLFEISQLFLRVADISEIVQKEP